MIMGKGTPTQNGFVHKQGSNGRIGLPQLKALLQEVAPPLPVLPVPLLMKLCNQLDRGNSGYLSTKELENVLYSVGLNPSEVAEVRQVMVTHTSSGGTHPEQLVDIVSFIRIAKARSHTEAIRKLGVLLRCRSASLLQHVRAWGVLPPVMRPSIILAGRGRGTNAPSSIVYPRYDTLHPP